MLKKLLILNLFLAMLLGGTVNVFALRWGVFGKYTRNYEDFALSYALDGEPVLYYIIVDRDTKNKRNSTKEADSIQTELENKLADELMNEEKAASLASDVDKSFKLWFKETASAIKKAGRAKEFADIMDILNNSIQTKRVYNKEEADIIIHYTTNEKMKEKCGDRAAGCITLYEVPRVITIINPYPIKYIDGKASTNAALFHEIGHFYGLVDQYKDLQDSSIIYSTEDRFADYNSVMGASLRRTLGCDDVDGFINLIDITLSLENGGQFSQRAKEGWASFCNGKQQPYTHGKNYKDTFYKEGKITNRDTYKRGLCTYKFDKDGNVAYSYCDFDVDGIIVSYKNKNFLYEKNSMGEKIFIPDDVQFSRRKALTLSPNKECKTKNYTPVPVEGYEGFDLTLKNGRLQEDLGNTFFLNKDTYIKVIKDKGNNCHLKLMSRRDLFTLNGNNITNEHNFEIDFCMERYSLTKEELINIAKNKCNDNIPQAVIDGIADICDFMENLEIPEVE